MNGGFYRWWKKIDGMLGRGLIILFAALIISQIMMMNETVKDVISRTDRLEGKSIEDSQLYIKKGEIELSIENISSMRDMTFYVNGEKVAASAGRTVKLTVKDSDILEVSGADYNEMAVLKITATSDNVVVPELGKLIYVNNNLVMIDRVRLK